MTARHLIRYWRGVKYVAAGHAAPASFKSPATCGDCGRTWDDAHVSGLTPAPSARCPFESIHRRPEPSTPGAAMTDTPKKQFIRALISGTPQRQINRLREALAVAIDCMRTTEDTGDDGASDQCIRDCLRVLRETKP